MAKSSPLTMSPLPFYEQIKQHLTAAIMRGDYQPGARLPSESELMQQFGVSRITVRQAIGIMEREGLVIRRHGKGTYVMEPVITQDLLRLTDFVEDMEEAGMAPSSRVLAFQRTATSAEVAQALRLDAGKRIVRLERLRLANEQPIALDVTWLPEPYGALLKEIDLEHETIFHYLETRYRVAISKGMFGLTAANATPEQAKWLDVSPGAALLCIERLALMADHAPLYLQRRWYRPDRVQYRIVVQRSARSAQEEQVLQGVRSIAPDDVSTQHMP